MSKAEIANLVVEILKLLLGYSVTVPVTIITFCVLFRTQIGTALGRLSEVTFPGGGAKFIEAKAVEEYSKSSALTLRQEKETVEKKQADLTPEQRAALKSLLDLSFSLLRLVTDFMPLVPRPQRRRFIEAVPLPAEFEEFRRTLFDLAEKAPEVHSLDVSDVLQLSESVRVELSPPPLQKDEGTPPRS